MNTHFHGLLLSSGFSSPVIQELVTKIASERKYTYAHIVTTARPEKENAPWNKVTKEQLEGMGMKVSFVDFDVGESLDDKVDCVYVCGGNTFHLLSSIQKSSAPIREQIVSLCTRGGLYIGSSAGAVLVGPSINSAGEIHPDRNKDGVVDTTAFNFIQEHIVPHYTPALDEEINHFCEKHTLSSKDLVLLRDGEALYIDGDNRKMIG